MIKNSAMLMGFTIKAIICVFLGFATMPAHAAVIAQNNNGFVSRVIIETKASPRAAWLKLISPAQWWDAKHTWTGSAANLSLTPQAGGCFCEAIPAVVDPKQIGLQGSAEHMRVIQAAPDKVLRMHGALGPLQSEAAAGVLTISIAPSDNGSQITAEYVVGGFMRFDVAKISIAVDAVVANQMHRLGNELGMVDVVKSASPPTHSPVAAESASADGDGKKDTKPNGAAPVSKSQVKAAAPTAAAKVASAKTSATPKAKVGVPPAVQPAPKPAPKAQAKAAAKVAGKVNAKPAIKPSVSQSDEAQAPNQEKVKEEPKRMTVDEAFGKLSTDE